MSNDIDENLFEQVFGHAPIKLADKLIDTTNKEKNQIIVKILTKIKKNFTKQMNFIILWSNSNNMLILDTLIILFQTLMKQFNYIWFENIKIKKRASDFNWGKQSKIMKHFLQFRKIYFFLVCV